MENNNSRRKLTKAEMEVMNVLWDGDGGLSINDVIEQYPDPKPAYTTVATFLKILEQKGYVEHFKKDGVGRSFYFLPTMTREKYTTQVLNDVKNTLFGNSAKKLFSFFVQMEQFSDEDIQELLQMVKLATPTDENYPNTLPQ